VKYKSQHEWELLHSTPGKYSMAAAALLLKRLEKDGWTIKDSSWKTADFGNLVERGIELEADGFTFAIMCSDEDVFIMRRVCTKAKYRQVFEELQQHVAATG
jgi:hypothetical protein